MYQVVNGLKSVIAVLNDWNFRIFRPNVSLQLNKKMCDYIACGTETIAQVQRCSRCQARAYCSKACQKGDWSEHKLFCKKRSAKEQRYVSQLEAQFGAIEKMAEVGPPLINDIQTDALEYFHEYGRGCMCAFISDPSFNKQGKKQGIKLQTLQFQYFEETNEQLKVVANLDTALAQYDPKTQVIVLLICQDQTRTKQVTFFKLYDHVHVPSEETESGVASEETEVIQVYY